MEASGFGKIRAYLEPGHVEIPLNQTDQMNIAAIFEISVNVPPDTYQEMSLTLTHAEEHKP